MEIETSPTYFVAVGVTGVTEWLKNFLPEKVKECKPAMAGIAAGLSIASSIGYLFVNKEITGEDFSVKDAIVFCSTVVGMTQVAYTMLLQTFKSIIAKLTGKTSE